MLLKFCREVKTNTAAFMKLNSAETKAKQKVNVGPQTKKSILVKRHEFFPPIIMQNDTTQRQVVAAKTPVFGKLVNS